MSIKHQNLVVSAAPHVNNPVDTAIIMRDVCIALVPALIWAIYIFGFRALVLTAVCVAASVFFEWLVRKIICRFREVIIINEVVTSIIRRVDIY